MKHDIGKLEERIRGIDKKMKRTESLYEILNPIIHRPGWTTLAEVQFMNLALDALESHADGLTKLQTQLIQAANAVEPAKTSGTAAA